MGLKDAAKALVAKASVPVVTGYHGAEQGVDFLAKEAQRIGYPVLIKAVAGGGGKGMRLVDSADAFAEALASCKREAAASFGDDRVLLETYVTRPRHIEVQVFGDSHGNVVHLFERDCSLQRRHQKVIEEAPAPGMDEATREAICDAAVRAARAVDYVGAGTIEFIADASEGLRADRIWFMEMNTRLQVEHPVTEEITRQDLVEWQLRVASGEVLPRQQEDLWINGWAMEARLYAEDPSKGFLPSTGHLESLSLPYQARVDTGVGEGSIVSPYYDPMIAKVICHGATRESARLKLADACRGTQIRPVRTNAEFLVRALTDEAFAAGQIDTGLIDRHLATLTEREQPNAALLSAGAVQLLQHPGNSLMEEPILSGTGAREYVVGAATRWNTMFGLRLNAPPNHVVRLAVDDEPITIDLDEGGLVEPGRYDVDGRGIWVGHEDDGFRHYFARRGSNFVGNAASAADGAILSPMPGRIIAVAVAAGDAVTKGQKLVTLEAMKMEHSLTAPFDGTIAELDAETGAQVSEGKMLVRVEKAA
eukprot:gene36538-49227_t